MSIEADRHVIIDSPMDVEMLTSLHETAMLAATHYSTQIEGNKLTRKEVEEAVAGMRFPGRERDEKEVKNYYIALKKVEEITTTQEPVSENMIRQLHGLVMYGKFEATPYRDGQNVIRDSLSGRIVYMPPEFQDVPPLMADMFIWLQNQLDTEDLPIPLVAALIHYQFATIHPYYDGNGRTARLLTTLILHQSGYGMKGIYSLEEYYARDLQAYYRALTVGESHNYYMGRGEADVTGFLTYFCQGMADSFRSVRLQAQQAAYRGGADTASALRLLDPKERQLLQLFQRHAIVSTRDIAEGLGLSVRTTYKLCASWVANGVLLLHNSSRKDRLYRLSDRYESLITRR